MVLYLYILYATRSRAKHVAHVSLAHNSRFYGKRNGANPDVVIGQRQPVVYDLGEGKRFYIEL